MPTDPMREALERIEAQGAGHYDRVTGRRVADHDESLPWVHWASIARDALAAAPVEPEPEYEYRSCAKGRGDGSLHASYWTGYEEAKAEHDFATQAESSWDEAWIERRAKPGKPERCD